MEIRENQKITGVFEIRLAPHVDQRGFFMRVYDEEILGRRDLHRHWVQENHSRSERKGIIRGLHFQLPPHAETKLVRCIRGKVFDIFVDLRRNSRTFGQWGSVILSEKEPSMVYIPRGMAHGFCTLEEESEVLYKVDSPYSPKHECGLLWNDPDLAITWPEVEPFLSDKDRSNMTLKEFVTLYRSIASEENL